MPKNTQKYPDHLPPVMKRLGEGPKVSLISAEDRPWRDLKAWRFLVRLTYEQVVCTVWWAIDGCERHEGDKVMKYLRERGKREGVTRIEVFEYVRPVTLEIRMEIEAFNRRLDRERRGHGRTTELQGSVGDGSSSGTRRLPTKGRGRGMSTSVLGMAV